MTTNFLVPLFILQLKAFCVLNEVNILWKFVIVFHKTNQTRTSVTVVIGNIQS